MSPKGAPEKLLPGALLFFAGGAVRGLLKLLPWGLFKVPGREHLGRRPLLHLNRFQVAAQIADPEQSVLGVSHVHFTKDGSPDGHLD